MLGHSSCVIAGSLVFGYKVARFDTKDCSMFEGWLEMAK